MALDELNDNDEVTEAGGFKILVEKSLAAQTGDIKIDMTYYGFVVEAQNPVGGGGGSCSSGSCSSGSCSC